MIQHTIDSGSTHHYVTSPTGLSDIDTSKSIAIEIANNTIVHSRGQGNISGKLHIVPEFSSNLLSVAQLCKQGYTVCFKPDGTVPITDNDGHVTCCGALAGNVYELQIRQQCKAAQSVNIEEKIWLLHRRWAHFSADRLHKLVSSGADVALQHVPIEVFRDVCGRCHHCRVTKSKGQPHRDLGGKISSQRPFELLHFDTKGPMEVASYDKNKYALIIVCDFTRAKYVYPMKSKTEALDKLHTFIGSVVRPLGHHVSRFHSDNAGEFISKEFQQYATDNGIALTYSSPHASESNGIAERAIQQIDTTARALRTACDLPKAAWAEMYKTAAFFERLAPPANGEPSPFVKIHGHDPPYSFFKAIGSRAYVHIHETDRRPLDKRATKGLLVGYSDTSRCYRILTDLTHGGICESTDVTFVESSSVLSPTAEGHLVKEPLPNHMSERGESLLAIELRPDVGSGPPDILVDDDISDKALQDILDPPDYPIYPATSMSEDHVMTKLDPAAFIATKITDKDAIKTPMFVEAMNKEINHLLESGAMEIVPLPPGRKAIGCVWAHKIKTVNGVFERAKSRLCPQGFSQIEGIDYKKDEVAAPTIALPSVKVYFAIVCTRNMLELQLDVDGAFTIPQLNEEIYMRFPRGMEHIPGKALLLKHSLNGLKQGAYNWYKVLKRHLLQQQFEQCITEPCIFRKWRQQSLILIALYTDDLRIAADNEKDLLDFEVALGEAFPIKRANISQFLGIQVVKSAEDKSIFCTKSLMSLNCSPNMA